MKTVAGLRGCEIARSLVAALLVCTACRTARPTVGETPIAPVNSAQELAKIRDSFRGERSVVRIRSLNGSHVESVKAQLQVGSPGDMLITVYTPLNTTAARLYANQGQIVFLNDIEHTAWQGNASELGGSFSFIAADPAALAFLLLGLPPRGLNTVTYDAAGLQSARFQDLIVAYDPPMYPPKRVVIVRGPQRVEIDHLESYVSPAPIEKLTVPKDYRCCVMPSF